VTEDTPNPTTPDDALDPAPGDAPDAAHPETGPGAGAAAAGSLHAAHPPSSADVRPHRPDYKGAELDPERGPGLGCFWFQMIVLGFFIVLIPIGLNLNWPFEVLAILLFVVIGLLLLTGQTVIFLLRLVAADRRAQGRRRPLASPTKTVGELEDQHRVAHAVGGGPRPAAEPAAQSAGPAAAAADVEPPAQSADAQPSAPAEPATAAGPAPVAQPSAPAEPATAAGPSAPAEPGVPAEPGEMNADAQSMLAALTPVGHVDDAPQRVTTVADRSADVVEAQSVSVGDAVEAEGQQTTDRGAGHRRGRKHESSTGSQAAGLTGTGVRETRDGPAHAVPDVPEPVTEGPAEPAEPAPEGPAEPEPEPMPGVSDALASPETPTGRP
jgi:hypothetical protein